MKVTLFDSRKNEDDEYPKIEVEFEDLDSIDKRSPMVSELVLDVRDALIDAYEMFPDRRFMPLMHEAVVGKSIKIVVTHDAFDYLKLTFRPMVEAHVNQRFGITAAHASS